MSLTALQNHSFLQLSTQLPKEMELFPPLQKSADYTLVTDEKSIWVSTQLILSSHSTTITLRKKWK